MADEIKQIFGLDVSAALKGLEQLDSAFNKTFSALASNSNFEQFNNNARGTINTLNQMRDAAKQAAAELAKVGRVPSAGGGVGGGGVSRAPQPKLLTGDAAGDALGALLGDTEAKARNAARSAQQTGSAFQQASSGVSTFAISFETLSRVLATQLIVRTLSQIRNAIEDSVGSFIQFNRAIAEIQTISEDETFAQLGEQVRALSDQFNAPLLDVAKAKYEALSNGFDTAESSSQLLTAALKFSKVGIASTAESIDLLSTALNAYGNDASHAEQLSAKLFETIRLGRVIGSELANSFGRVAPFGKQIGASEDELLAAFSSITIGGVKANEAATQIRATISSLLKPSEAMKEALHSLGFESGEQIIGAKGFQGALLALKGTTDGSATALSKLFPNVRAIGGVFRETSTGLDIYQDHLERISKISAETLNKKFQIRIDSDAERVSNDLNRLKNFFTVDLGSQLTGKLSSVFQSLGGIETVINAAKELVPTLILGTGALTGMAAAATAVSFANKALSVSFFTLQADGTRAFSALTAGASAFKLAMLGLGALILSYDIGKFIGSQLVDSIEKPINDLKDLQAQFRQFRAEQIDAENNLANLKTESQTREINDFLGRVRKAGFDEVDAAKEKNDELLATNKDTLERLVQARSKYATDLQRAATTAENDVVASKKREVDAVQELDDARFDYSIRQFHQFANRTNPASLFFIDSQRQQQRALALAQQSVSALSSANLPSDREAALNGLKRAESYAKAAIESARSAKNVVQEQEAQNALFHILRQKAEVEQQYQNARKQAAAQEEQAAARERQRVDTLRQKVKDFLDASNLFDKKGQVLPDSEIAKNKAKAASLLTEIRGLAFGKDSQFDIGQFLAFDKLEKQFRQNFTNKEISVLFNETPGNLESLHQKIQGDIKKFGPILLQFAEDPSKLIGKSLKEAIDEATAQATERAQRIPELRNAAKDEKLIGVDLTNKLNLAQQLLAQQKSLAERFFGGGVNTNVDQQFLQEHPAFQQKIDLQKEYDRIGAEIQRQIDKAQKGGALDEGAIAALQNRLSKTINNDLNVGFGLEGGRRQQALQALREFVALQEKRNLLEQKFPDAARELQNLEKRQQGLGFDAFTDRLDFERQQEAKRQQEEAARANQGALLQQSSGLNQSVALASEYANQMERAARAAQAAVPPIGSLAGSAFEGYSGEVYSYTGGQIPQYFDSGGPNRGIDTINAKLAPREFVMNQQASSRFFSQLQAMNAGVAPQATRSTSGDTYQIGDINIHETASPKQTAREVLNAIYRQQRRGAGRSLK